jgi:hypothetical protein
MSEPKTQCTDCGVSILQRTADRLDGRCAPCHGKATAKPPPPEGFELPRDLAVRFAALDLDPASLRDMAWHEGLDSVRGFVERCEEAASLFRQWSPKLRKFVAECRVSNPCPDERSLPARDRAKLPIFKVWFQRTIPLAVSKNAVFFCSLPLFAIPMYQRLCPPDNDRYVCLTPMKCRSGTTYTSILKNLSGGSFTTGGTLRTHPGKTSTGQ